MYLPKQKWTIKLWDKKIISLKPEFDDLLKAEAIKNRYNKKEPKLLTQQLKNAQKRIMQSPQHHYKKSWQN